MKRDAMQPTGALTGAWQSMNAESAGTAYWRERSPSQDRMWGDMSLETLTFGTNGQRLERIPPSSLAYLSQRARNTCYAYVMGRFYRSGMTKAELGRRIGKRPDQINHMLASPGNWTIRTVAQLLAGIADEEFVPSAKSLKGRQPINMFAWIKRFFDKYLKMPTCQNCGDRHDCNDCLNQF